MYFPIHNADALIYMVLRVNAIPCLVSLEALPIGGVSSIVDHHTGSLPAGLKPKLRQA